MELLTRDLLRTAPKTEALLRVYKDQIVLNDVAARLLDLTEDSKLAFKVSSSGYVYVGKRTHAGWGVHKRGNTFRIRCCDLARSLQAQLQGCGTYRIAGEDSGEDISGNTYYSIYFRKYDKENPTARNIKEPI